jgi:hypothetical protein
MNIVDEQKWTVVYNGVKTDFQNKKKHAPLIAAADGKDLMDKLQSLEKSLNIMKESPMEYELSLSEIARRQVILENMKKQVVSASTATCYGGKVSSHIPSFSVFFHWRSQTTDSTNEHGNRKL